MPLPDAKPSARIYELLKTTDLENITFNQFQGVAEKIFAEQGAEDELRRIVLVNLARLSVVGEWTGLTSAGSSGASNAVWQKVDVNDGSGSTVYYPLSIAATESYTAQFSVPKRPRFHPFVPVKDGSIALIGINVASGSSSYNMKVAVYDTDANGLPGNKVGGEALVNMASGFQTAAPDATITLTGGEQYYVAFCVSSGTSNTATVYSSQYTTGIFPTTTNYNAANAIQCLDSDNTLPSSFTGKDLRGANSTIYKWKFTYA